MSAAERSARGVQVVTRASAGVALGDTVLRALMDTSYVDLVFLEQEMQLMVKDAVAAKSRGDDSATMSTNAGVMRGVGFATPAANADDSVSEGNEDSDEGDGPGGGNASATDTLDLSASKNGASKKKPKSLVQAAAAQKDSESVVSTTVDLSREEKHDVRSSCCALLCAGAPRNHLTIS